MTSRVAADTLNETLATHVAPTLMGVTPDNHMKRIAVTGRVRDRGLAAAPDPCSPIRRWPTSAVKNSAGGPAPVFRQLLVGPAPSHHAQR